VVLQEEVVFTATPNCTDVELTFMDQDAASGSRYYTVRVMQDDRQMAWSIPIGVNYQP